MLTSVVECFMHPQLSSTNEYLKDIGEGEDGGTKFRDISKII